MSYFDDKNVSDDDEEDFEPGKAELEGENEKQKEGRRGSNVY